MPAQEAVEPRARDVRVQERAHVEQLIKRRHRNRLLRWRQRRLQPMRCMAVIVTWPRFRQFQPVCSLMRIARLSCAGSVLTWIGVPIFGVVVAGLCREISILALRLGRRARWID